MLVVFFLTLTSFILAFHYFSPIVALGVILAIGAYYIKDLANSY